MFSGIPFYSVMEIFFHFLRFLGGSQHNIVISLLETKTQPKEKLKMESLT